MSLPSAIDPGRYERGRPAAHTALLYLGAVLVVAAATGFPHAGLWPELITPPAAATLPVSVAGAWLGWSPACLIGAVVNAWVLWIGLRGRHTAEVRARRATPDTLAR